MAGCEDTLSSLRHIVLGATIATAWLGMMTPVATAQNCTTQAQMSANTRQSLSDTALALAEAIQSGDTAKVQALAAPDIAADATQTAALVSRTSGHIAGDGLRVAQIYQLDASSRASDDSSPAEFSCPLLGTVSEVDFSISSLPAGMYGFAMVEAAGPRPWLLSFLLRQNGSSWQMAGFYQHSRTAAGHDGVWYWRAARAAAESRHPWLAWLDYGEAEKLLRPAEFMTSTNLDKLTDERSEAAPATLRNGVSTESPLSIGGFSITSLATAESPDGKSLDLLVHYSVASVGDAAAAQARNAAVAKAVLDAHPELRQGFGRILVFADAPGQPSFPSELAISAIA